MDIQLGSAGVRLLAAAPPIQQSWRALLTGWEAVLPAGPLITYDISLTPTLPPPPPIPPIFRHPLTGMTIFPSDGGYEMRFPGRAVIQHPAGMESDPIKVHGRLTPQAANPASIEDITFTALAPWLRRAGWFLVHAFGAARNGRACLVVGPSQSGKTTTGLRLVLAGWQLLGNDLVLLQNRPEGVIAVSTPGQIRVRPETLSLLPALRSYLDYQFPDGRAVIAREKLSPAANDRPVHVSHILFPQVQQEHPTAIKPISQGVTLARLAVESLDRWDKPTLAPHLDCLQQLSAQAEGADLYLGRNAHTIINHIHLE